MNLDSSNPTNSLKKELTLTDGRKAQVRMGTGKDLQNAMRIASDNEERTMVMASLMTTIDEKPLYYDEFLLLNLRDCYALIGAMNELLGNESSQTPSS